MQGRFLTNVVIFFGIGISTILEKKFNEISILVHDGNMEGSAPIYIPTVYLCLFVYFIWFCTFKQIDGVNSIWVRNRMKQ